MIDIKPTNSLQPSGSSIGSAVGGMVATLLMIVLTQVFNLHIDAVSAVSIGGGMAALTGYFFSGGRQTDTE